MSPDGAKVYLGGSADGLQVASTADYAFRQTSAVPVQCLRADAGLLYICSDELAAGVTLGQSRDDGVTIEPTLHLSRIRGPLTCPPASSTAACLASWPALEQQLGIPSSTADAGFTADAGPIADASLAADASAPSDASLASDAPAESSDAAATLLRPPPREAPGACRCNAAGAYGPVAPGSRPLAVVALLLASGRRRHTPRARGLRSLGG
jgi:hypothetical protein